MVRSLFLNGSFGQFGTIFILEFIWSFWTRLVMRSLFFIFIWPICGTIFILELYLVLLDPFGGAIFEFYLVLLDPFGGAIFLVLFWTRLVVQSLSLIILELCDGYVRRSVITNILIYLVHCDLRCHM